MAPMPTRSPGRRSGWRSSRPRRRATRTPAGRSRAAGRGRRPSSGCATPPRGRAGAATLDLFAARRPAVVLLTASLARGAAKSGIVALRARVPWAEVGIVVIGDDAGAIRTALDALDLAPDRFVTRPVSPRALRFAV